MYMNKDVSKENNKVLAYISVIIYSNKFLVVTIYAWSFNR